MSQTLHVVLRTVPNRDAWQAAIVEAGFDLTLDPAFIPTTNVGYVPARFGTVDSAFEFEISSMSEGVPAWRELSLSPDFAIAANFTWSPHDVESDCAAIAAACLAKLTHGVFYDPQEGKTYQGEDAVTRVREWVRDAPR